MKTTTFHTTRQAMSYFRMGLVTGLVTIEELVDWVDRELLRRPDPEEALLTLSLSGRLPHSQLLWLLSDFEGEPDYGRPLTLLLARAADLLRQEPDRLPEIIMGLRLLNEEEYFPGEIGRQIADLRRQLRQAEPGGLHAETWRFLRPYAVAPE